MKFATNGLIKITACLCCIMIIAALFISHNSPATGYESSIYASTPVIVWLFLIATLVCGLGIIVHQVYRGQLDTNRAWQLGLLLVLLCYTSVLSLYVIRGYLLWGRGDVLWHLAATNDVLETGHVFTSNYYPISHLLVAQLSLVSGVEPTVLFGILPIFFAVLYIMFNYLLARLVLPGKGQVLLATAASTVFVHAWYVNFGTTNFAVMMLPLAFFVGLKFATSSDYQNRAAKIIMLFIIVLVYPPLHMQPALAIFILIVSTPLFPILYRHFKKIPPGLFPTAPRWNIVIPIFIIIWWMAWVSSFSIYTSFSRNVYSLLIFPGKTPLQSLVDGLQNVVDFGYTAFDLVNGFVRVYGNAFLYMVISLIAFFVISKQLATRPRLIRVYSLYGPITIFMIMMLALFVIQSFFSPNRILVYIVLLCTMPVGYLLSETLDVARTGSKNKPLTRALVPAGITAFLVLVSVIGIFKVYSSPETYEMGQQVTDGEVKATEHLLQYTDRTIQFADYYSIGMRDMWYIADAAGSSRSIQVNPFKWDPSLPYHFAYDLEPFLGASFEEDRYLLVNDRFRLQYVEVFPDLAPQRFLPGDFQELDGDVTIDKVYTNGGVDLRYIHGTIVLSNR